MNTTEKKPLVIIHSTSWDSPKLPAKHWFAYRTDVNVDADMETLTVSVMKRSLLTKFFLGRDRIIATREKQIPRNQFAQKAATAMENELFEELFPSS